MNSMRVAERSSIFVGIVTVLFNSEQVLPDFFHSLSLQKDVEFKLYVIDNSSSQIGTKLSQSLSDKYNINLEIIFNNKNVGVAAGNNQGVALAQRDNCTHILFANNDTDFSAGVIRKLLIELTSSSASAISPKIYFYGTDRLWFAGGSMSAWRAKNTHWFYGKQDKNQIIKPTAISYAPTCFLLVDAAVLSQVGLMDEKYFCYWDDTDFIFRFLKYGYKLLYAPAININHKVSFSTGGDKSPFSVYYNNRNRIYYARKNNSGLIKISSIFFVLLTRTVRLLCLPQNLRARLIDGLYDGFKIDINNNSTHK
ncbi:MAG: glycosyltransferase family 2 protein [Burkholderiales bacterium]|jgi:GT2 family glycosyltransferase|nr:glycosyltransferase family 2 protein [Burkholderiales bacterium]